MCDGMVDREKVINALQQCVGYEDVDNKYTCIYDGDTNPNCPYGGTGGNGVSCMTKMMRDALALLKAQEEATIEPKRIDLEEETKAWLDKMDAVDALGNIADICIDWDGYRTADGLGRLVNEIWAYARYCADRLAKAQEPCEDAVSRKAVINITAETGALETQARIKQLPSVQSVHVPRVLILEEIRMHEVYWAEQENVSRPWPIAMHHIRNVGLLDGPMYQDYMGDNFNAKEYGEKWRVWTSCPSDAVRRATPWHG